MTDVNENPSPVIMDEQSEIDHLQAKIDDLTQHKANLTREKKQLQEKLAAKEELLRDHRNLVKVQREQISRLEGSVEEVRAEACLHAESATSNDGQLAVANANIIKQQKIIEALTHGEKELSCRYLKSLETLQNITALAHIEAVEAHKKLYGTT